MKKLLLLPIVLFVMLIAAMVNPFGCNAQKDTSYTSKIGKISDVDITHSTDTTIYGTILSGPIWTELWVDRIDTVRIIMLIADTTYIPGDMTFTAYIGSGIKIMESKNRVPYVFWQFGYLVTGTSLSHTFIPYYLDEKKKPLPKSIIVFQSLSLK